MKIKSVFLLSSLTMALGLGVFAGISGLKERPVEEAKAENITFYFRGSATDDGNYAGNWTSYLEKPIVADTQSYITIKFEAASKFKVDTSATSEWGTSLGWSNCSGYAKDCFEASGEDIVCQTAGSYLLSVFNNVIYIDFINFNIHGGPSGEAWTKGTEFTVGGASKTLNLAKNYAFKFVPNGEWKYELNKGNMLSDYYHCFSYEDNGNIVTRYAFNYDVSIYRINADLKIDIKAHNPTMKEIYVLDLNGNLINEHHNAHFFKYIAEDEYELKTDWPGTEMAKVENTKNIYKVSYWDVMEKLIVNNKVNDVGTQTYDLDLSGKDGKCFVLTWAYSEEYKKWTSEDWVSLDSAKFIDEYMKFETAHEGAKGEGLCKTAGWYSSAKEAYGDLDNAEKEEISTLKIVADRLSAWADANNEEFKITNNIGSFGVKAINEAFITSSSTSKNDIILIISVVTISLLASICFISIKKKKEI